MKRTDIFLTNQRKAMFVVTNVNYINIYRFLTSTVYFTPVSK